MSLAGWAQAGGSGQQRLAEVRPEQAVAAAVANLVWLEDCAARLICVLALDRFGDYVSDQVCIISSGLSPYNACRTCTAITGRW